MDHPLVSPADDLNPWRATALVVGAIAAVELVVLVVAGVALLGRSVGHERNRPAVAKRHAAPAARPHRVVTAVTKPKLTRAQTSVLVLNGNGVSGAAGAAATRVSGLGYRIGGVGNTAQRTDGRSVIMYREGFRAEGLRLGRDLHVGMVGPLDGLRAADLHGARLAYVVGS